MLSPRSYRAALSAEAAAEEVRKGAGSQFDPEVAVVLLRITDSLASLFQKERDRTNEEAERLAKEIDKREAKEARKAEKQAKKEAERLAKERNKIEAEEAKKASKAEKQAKKEAERLAKERNKIEAEETRRASKVEIEANKEAEPLAEVKKIIEARQAREDEIDTKDEADHNGGAKIYDGNVLLVVPPPVVFEQARHFKEYLERVENLRILFFGASADEGFIIAVSAQQPETLIQILNEMSIIEKAIKKSEKQIVLTLKETAAY
jgi:DNA repair exonuclease SbcCD ATPase subunit